MREIKKVYEVRARCRCARMCHEKSKGSQHRQNEEKFQKRAAQSRKKRSQKRAKSHGSVGQPMKVAACLLEYTLKKRRARGRGRRIHTTDAAVYAHVLLQNCAYTIACMACNGTRHVAFGAWLKIFCEAAAHFERFVLG